ncbi:MULTISPECIES: DUF2933 domain-containing protein [Streptomyces]|uniref:DUF2933 domain-containing protein n=1 Tax=Streptomyces TaxID=1883 RepID=UPI002E2B4FF9|nr:hypothetical protein [Streptomyces phaeochromogenes]
MQHKNFAPYAIAAAILVVGLVALGAPLSTLLLLGIFVACPLMMMFMMRGMHGGGGHDQHSGHEGHQHDDRPTDDSQDRLHKHL